MVAGLLRMTDVSEEDGDQESNRRSLMFLGYGGKQIVICIITIIATRNNALGVHLRLSATVYCSSVFEGSPQRIAD